MHWREMVHRSEHSYKHTISFWSQMQCYTISRVYQWLEKHHVWSPLASEDVTHTVVMVILWIYNRTIRQVCNNFLPPSPRADFFLNLQCLTLACWTVYQVDLTGVLLLQRFQMRQSIKAIKHYCLKYSCHWPSLVKNLLFTCCKSLFKGYIYHLNI